MPNLGNRPIDLVPTDSFKKLRETINDTKNSSPTNIINPGRAPLATDDISEDYLVGDVWTYDFNGVTLTYRLLDNTVDAAIWYRSPTNIINPSRAPLATDDISEDYLVGDVWIYTNSGVTLTYRLLDNTVDAAIWYTISSTEINIEQSAEDFDELVAKLTERDMTIDPTISIDPALGAWNSDGFWNGNYLTLSLGEYISQSVYIGNIRGTFVIATNSNTSGDAGIEFTISLDGSIISTAQTTTVSGSYNDFIYVTIDDTYISDTIEIKLEITNESSANSVIYPGLFRLSATEDDYGKTALDNKFLDIDNSLPIEKTNSLHFGSSGNFTTEFTPAGGLPGEWGCLTARRESNNSSGFPFQTFNIDPEDILRYKYVDIILDLSQMSLVNRSTFSASSDYFLMEYAIRLGLDLSLDNSVLDDSINEFNNLGSRYYPDNYAYNKLKSGDEPILSDFSEKIVWSKFDINQLDSIGNFQLFWRVSEEAMAVGDIDSAGLLLPSLQLKSAGGGIYIPITLRLYN